MSDRKKVYLAGPDVFLPNAKAHGEKLKKACADNGLEGLYPLDPELSLTLGDPASGITIFHSDVELMDQADAIVANMSPFRGVSMDTGTAFEMGYMHAQGKPVFGYSSEHDMSYSSKVIRYHSPLHEAEGGVTRDRDGLLVEDFGMTDNLMMVAPALATAGRIFPTAEEAIKFAALYLLDKAKKAS